MASPLMAVAPSTSSTNSSPVRSLDLTLRLLHLEQQLDSYQRLHCQELEDLRRSVTQLREEVLMLLRQGQVPLENGAQPAAEQPLGPLPALS
ncbi:MAG: hypothetical protein NZ528_15475 [Caldilineales bacterium]|nr:hypothetical protein [Caldilineales bacterium]MDW8317346.1 hypothetical protein [Anaerolineae bacterium]